MLLEELLRCQIHEWYSAFRRHSIPTVIIPLPAAFLRYLAGQAAYPDPNTDADGGSDEEPLPFLLPAITSGRQPFAPIHANHPDPVSLLNSEFFFDSSTEDVYDPDAEHPHRPEFPELEAAIDAAIAELGGAALPKLNWSAPKDATFMSAEGTTRCTCFAEVAMLLRASDCVAHDLASARQSCEDFVCPDGARRNARNVGAGAEESSRPNANETGGSGGISEALGDSREIGEGVGKTNAAGCDVEDAPEEESNEDTWVDDGFRYYLALRKWYTGLRPESEFRCFVKDRKLVAVSQRDTSAYYPSLPGWSSEVQPKIEAFFEEVIGTQFGSKNYTFDVYVRTDGRVKLIDFNPWGGYTLPLLFSWEELEEEGREHELEFRVVMQQGAVRPGLMTAVPYDMLDWGQGSGWDVFLKKADEELNRQRNSHDGDIESTPFIEALSQFSYRAADNDFCLVHVSLVPVIDVVGEQKTKPTQFSVQSLRELGLTPNLLACRSVAPLNKNVKEKLSQFCHVPVDCIVSLSNVPNIWHVPSLLIDQKGHEAILGVFGLAHLTVEPKLDAWMNIARTCDPLHVPVKIAVVGKCTNVSNAYISILEALLHASVACQRRLAVNWVLASDLDEETANQSPDLHEKAWSLLKGADGVLVPGGFGHRGIEGQIMAAKYARENNVP